MRKKVTITLICALCACLILPGCDTAGDVLSQKGWKEENGNRYYLDDEGGKANGFLEIEGETYYFDEEGVMQTGWVAIDASIFFFDENGAMQTGWTKRDGVRCYLNEDGSLAAGWTDIGGQRYYMDANGAPVTGWQELDGKRYYFMESGPMLVGWAEFSGQRYCFSQDGTMLTGWNDVGESRYYFNEDGTMYTGWLQEGDRSYYLKEDGAMAVGPTEIDGATSYFSPHGVHVLLVNPWNYLPEGYEADLVYADETQKVDRSCYDALMQMLSDCSAAGHLPLLVSCYRTQANQEYLYNRKVNYYLALDYERAEAEVEAAKSVAIPGTSEHQLGLAVDIIDAYYTNMDDAQADTETQKWLMEHCWDYGFILRYPVGSTDITGIIYEPWHYRYVGSEIAAELRDLGITLEEYLGAA